MPVSKYKMARINNLYSLKHTSKNERLLCMVAEQKSKSKFKESSDRNKPSKVSQFIPQTSDSATFKLPPDG